MPCLPFPKSTTPLHKYLPSTDLLDGVSESGFRNNFWVTVDFLPFDVIVIGWVITPGGSVPLLYVHDIVAEGLDVKPQVALKESFGSATTVNVLGNDGLVQKQKMDVWLLCNL